MAGWRSGWATPQAARWGGAALVVVTLLPAATARAQYVNRFITITNGAITFIGNTLGLSKPVSLNQPGTSDAIGAFITTTALQALPGQLVCAALGLERDPARRYRRAGARGVSVDGVIACASGVGRLRAAVAECLERLTPS